METDQGIPIGWAIPDDLSKKINDVLNNKRISPEDELADALGDMARDIALNEPDPMDWGGWVIYLLEQKGWKLRGGGCVISIRKC